VTASMYRGRRLRRTDALRTMVRETWVAPGHLVAPLFVCGGEGVRRPIDAMPGCSQVSVDELVNDCRELKAFGVGGIILFGIPDDKDPQGDAAADPDGPVARGLKAIAAEVPGLVRWADVCLCEYTDHGHCGPLRQAPTGETEVDNDRTVPLLAQAARVYADAGAEIVAPSDMMDGRVAAIRAQLDSEGHAETPIVAYSAKFASAFYGPFRDAAESAPAFGDRRGYQMDPANGREAVREARIDVDEGADVVMVKPALPYLDVIRRVREAVDVPVAAYNVSGEYAALKAAAERGWLDERGAVLESLTAIRRAGADVIVTYHAKEVARWLQG